MRVWLDPIARADNFGNVVRQMNAYPIGISVPARASHPERADCEPVRAMVLDSSAVERPLRTVRCHSEGMGRARRRWLVANSSGQPVCRNRCTHGNLPEKLRQMRAQHSARVRIRCEPWSRILSSRAWEELGAYDVVGEGAKRNLFRLGSNAHQCSSNERDPRMTVRQRDTEIGFTTGPIDRIMRFSREDAFP